MPRKRAALVSKLPICSTCGLEQETSDAVLAHKSSCVLKPTKGYFWCEKAGCGFKTKFAQSLKTHVSHIHIKTKMYSCELCDYRTVWKVALTGHYEIKHHGEGLEEWLITCEVQKLRQLREQKAAKKQIATDPSKPKRRYRRRSHRTSLGESVCNDSDQSHDLLPEIDADEVDVVDSGTVWFDYEQMDSGFSAPEPVVIEHDFITEATDFESTKLML
ncbi:hypothetical protein AAVH_31171 [Aphelenchoides avenae]|nr:hypothetical protein AAVH_31171 [Aphelenchus avenae]